MEEDHTRSVDLRESGILWHLNKSIMHPNGFALGMDENGNLYLMGNGTESWNFDDSIDQMGFQKWKRWLAAQTKKTK